MGVDQHKELRRVAAAFLAAAVLQAASAPARAQLTFGDPVDIALRDPLASVPGEPSLGTDASGTWIVVWNSNDTLGDTIGPDQDILLSRSTNDGISWTSPAALNTNASTDGQESGGSQDNNPTITAGDNDTWVAVWDSNGNISQLGIDRDIFVARSTDGGAVWSAPKALSPAAAIDNVEDQFPHVATDGAGTWVAAWGFFNNNACQTVGQDLICQKDVLVSRSTDDGATWSPPLALPGGPLDTRFFLDSPHPRVASDGAGSWVAIWDDVEVGLSGEDRDIWISRSVDNGATWTSRELLEANALGDTELDRFPSLATDGSGNWVVVWVSQEQQPLGQAYIATARSADNGGTWTTPQQLVQSTLAGHRIPWITTSGEGHWLTVMTKSAFNGTTRRHEGDVHLSESIDNGANWTTPLPLDADAILDGEEILGGGSLEVGTDRAGVWVATWMLRNDNLIPTRIQVARATDATPPLAGSVFSDTGPFTIDNTELRFSWSGFLDRESGIADYEVALGTVSDPEAFQAFTSVGLVTSSSFEASDLGLPAGEFADGEYVCTVRARNGRGFVSPEASGSVIVDTTALLVGESVPLPEGKTWADIDFAGTTFDPPTHVIARPGAEQVLAGDSGSFTINWAFVGGGGLTRQYVVSAEAVQEPVILYHTFTPDGAMQTGAPSVDLGGITNPTVHWNASVPQGQPGTGGDPGLWLDGNSVHAKGVTGLIVLEYTIGIEIVEVKANVPDVADGAVHIGSRLIPAQTSCEGLSPVVTRGGPGGDPTYIYQHAVVGSPQRGQVWAIYKNLNSFNMELVWMRTGLGGVAWPCELRRYTADWPAGEPDKYQLYVRGPSAENLGPSVSIPNTLNPEAGLTNGYYEEYEDPAHHSTLEADNTFFTDGPGWTLIKYQTGPTPGQDWVGFEVVRSVAHDDPTFEAAPWGWNLSGVVQDIGTEVTDAGHEGQRAGYIHEPEGSRYAPEVYADTGQVFPVNTGVLEVWWSNLSRTEDPEGPAFPPWPTERVQWPSRVVRYDAVWPASANRIVIARQDGTGPLDPSVYGADWSIYGADGSKEDPAQPGFNPNDENALRRGSAAYALRDDLGTPGTSLPYVLVQYQEQPAATSWRFEVFQVVREEAPYFLRDWTGFARPDDPYEGEAGLLIQQPFPLSTLTYCDETEAVSGPYFEDRTGRHWARAAGSDGASETITLRYFYPVQPGFFFPGSTPPPVGTCVPWLDDGTTTPADVVFTVFWPDDVPTLGIAQTLIEPQAGLPAIDGQCSVDIAYQQSVALGGGPSASLIDPVQAREVDLVQLPADIQTADEGSQKIFLDLSLALRERVRYDSLTQKLRFEGQIVDPITGFDYALLNVMSERERDELLALSGDAAWQAAAAALYQAAKDPVEILDSDTDPFDNLALTTGFAQGTGFVTLVLQNAGGCQSLPVSLEIVEVVPELDPRGLSIITAQCPFDEKLTLRHQGDFGGRPGSYQFEWRTLPDEDGTPPSVPIETGWNAFPTTPATGEGAQDVTIQGPGIFTLSDNWFVARYRYTGAGLPWSNQWSAWTDAQLAAGWIKRVVGDINPFEQRASGGGIQGAEDSFFSYADTEVNTIVSMISQAGPRWEGSVPLNCSGQLDELGLIEIYQTVLNRGIDLSIEGLPPVDYEPANNALLLVASRIADLHLLLGNEAFADASDPTIAFGTDDGQFGAEATSIHSFQNTTASLLDEELALLRGRDDSVAPGVQIAPIYNRLIWNFTNGQSGGEVAYALNYNVVDLVDAQAAYPQGHGDAWGHALTAIKTYYRLLRHPNYTWQNRSEAVLVGGTPVTVDYLDERAFATAAAAKARAGAEIVNLTYRDSYVEDPAGQWQGYKDNEPTRAWGFSEWAGRAGQGAYFDWVVGNALLPDQDPKDCNLPGADPSDCNDGIQKIDRTTIVELREVASRFEEVQSQVDAGDSGLNPLGLATNVVPFDISPTQIDAGQTHFEQVYDRAVSTLNNAITVFNHANNSTQLLRRQADTLMDFQRTVTDREVDFKNRLIEIFGYPYSDDIGPGRTYPTGYDGPDLHHYTYVDVSDLTGMAPGSTTELPLTMKTFDVQNDGSLAEMEQEIIFHFSTAADRFGLVKPESWMGERRAPGEIQLARSDLLQARARFERILAEYDNLIAEIEDQADLLEQQHDLNREEINVLNLQLSEQETLNNKMARARARQLDFRKKARIATIMANAVAEFLPTAVGLATDATAPARGAIRLVGTVLSEIMTQNADQESLAELDHQHALQEVQAGANITLTTLRSEFSIQERLKQLQQTVRRETALRIDLYASQEAMQQAAGRYLSALARGQRLLEDRLRFRKNTALDIQARRYKDMAFRIFRNDALQKYRAQFDLAARYVYLAAKAYDFETTFLSGDLRAGQHFLTDIVGARLIGTIQSGLPQTGQGLADPMARMSQNFGVLKGQLGFNNPQQETNRFSLRSELFRIQPGPAGDAVWRETLRRNVVTNLLDLPEFQRYARVFQPHIAVEPALVIPFQTSVNFGLNFFGWPAGGGDNAYDSTNFATKVRSVGVWFSNYNNLSMINTPRVYLIPTGGDVLRSPTAFTGETREFSVLDQKLPVPFPVGQSDLTNPDWIPGVDGLTDTFADIRKYSSFRAFHDAGQFDPNQVARDSRLIGRSVWNTQWVLMIPAGTLLFDREEGLNRFIDGLPVGGGRDGNGVKDIKIFFETYAFSGN